MISSNDWIESKKLNYWNIDEIKLSNFQWLVKSHHDFGHKVLVNKLIILTHQFFDITWKIISFLIRKLAHQNSDKLILSIFGSAQKYDQNFNHRFFNV